MKQARLEDVQVVKFIRGSAETFLKTSYAGENFKSSRFLQTTYEKNVGKDFERNKENRGAKPANTDKISQVLCPHMKKTTRIFWIPVDLVTFTEKFLNGKLHFLCSLSCKKPIYKRKSRIIYLKTQFNHWRELI